MNFKEYFGSKMLFIDGAMGTMLQQAGLKAGELPEKWNITNPDRVLKIHEMYAAAGCNVLTANTFGANGFKYNEEPFTVSAVISAGVKLAYDTAKKYSTPEKPCFAALNLGPTGKLLKPVGTLEFEDCVNIYKEAVLAGESAGAELILIETMSDTLEAKAAILAAKENSTLPVLISFTFDEDGRLLSGADISAAAVMAEGLCADAVGINCGLGPAQIKQLVKTLRTACALPVFVSPNAGLPCGEHCGHALYDINAEQFAQQMLEISQSGAWGLGGCCGTTPEHMQKTIEQCGGAEIMPLPYIGKTVVSGSGLACEIGVKPLIVGERINPTGKKRLKQALVEQDLDYILSEGIAQLDAGAHILDVNVGMPEIDEAQMLKAAVAALQGITAVPLQLDSASADALESAMRAYNGKPLVNSVNGKESNMREVFPLVKKYGGVVVGLTLDESGIPETAEGRVEIAKKIINTAKEYGIDKKDIIIDTLTMTISTGPENALITLKALKAVTEMGVKTVLGASNVSFGLPCREYVNTAFLAMAIMQGLSAAIINPCAVPVMAAFTAAAALCGFDEGCREYTARYSQSTFAAQAMPHEGLSLEAAVEAGAKGSAAKAAEALLQSGEAALDIIENRLMPALNRVGEGFENKTVFLPGLLMSAEAAGAAFDVIRAGMGGASGENSKDAPVVVIATVQGDIHDIGKNIVKVLLQNYNFKVIDLGKDVPPEEIEKAVLQSGARLCGLSALMTTTVGAMQKTIELLNASAPHCRVIVGGAVLTKSFAEKIGASFYAKTAMETVRYAQEHSGK